MTNSIDRVEREREGKRKLECGQRYCAKVKSFYCRHNRVSTFRASDSCDSEDSSIAGEGAASAAMRNGQHAGELRFVDGEMGRLRAI